MSGECAGPLPPAPALDGDPLYGVALLDVVHVLEEVQVQLVAVRRLQTVGGGRLSSTD